MINIVLYQPEIAANCGNIVRTCAALNARLHLIKPLGFSLDQKAFQRAGMDYILDCEIIEYENIEEFYKLNHSKNIYYITRYSNNIYTDMDVANPLEDYYFMFGKESSGIPYELLASKLDRSLRIPMKINARSLNLSNCVSIVAFEAARQQEFFNLSSEETFKGADFLDQFKD